LIGRAVDIDLILMGAYKGRGKRIGKYGSILVGVHHEGKIYPISKVGSSLSE
jgi:ATP-dependent DNA ligase